MKIKQIEKNIIKRASIGLMVVAISVTFHTFAGNPNKLNTTTATLMPNQSYVDGCQHYVIIGGKNYSLNSTSYSKVEELFAQNPDTTLPIEKIISYYNTNKKGIVSCGRAGGMKLPEIDIITIQ